LAAIVLIAVVMPIRLPRVEQAAARRTVPARRRILDDPHAFPLAKAGHQPLAEASLQPRRRPDTVDGFVNADILRAANALNRVERHRVDAQEAAVAPGSA
jgi:hypothetical protein